HHEALIAWRSPCIQKGAAMNTPRVVVVSLALANLVACASSGPAPKTEQAGSILEVLDQARSSAPRADGKCPVGAVTYCETDMGRTRCTCHDPEAVRAWLRHSFDTH